jgi:hypothetical protein
LTFDATAALVDWMHEEYLSALLLRAMKPKPSRSRPRKGEVSLHG